MPLNVQLVNAQVKDPQSGQMTPAGLIGSDAISTINTAKNQAIAAVQQKGEETLQSIPDDYTALSNEVDDVKTQIDLHSPSFTQQSYAYAYEDGSALTAARYGHTSPIAVSAGDVVSATVNGYSSAVAIICGCDSSGGTIVPKVKSNGNSMQTYTYTATENGYITISYTPANGISVKIYGQKSNVQLYNTVSTLTDIVGYSYTENNNPTVDENGKYIDNDGVMQANENWKIYGPIQMQVGDIITFTAKGVADVVSVLAATDQSETYYSPLIISIDGTEHNDFAYTATEDIYVVISSQSSTTVKYSIKKSDITKIEGDVVSIISATDVCAFASIGVIGDSLASGCTNYIDPQTETAKGKDRKAYSWGKFIEREHGVDVTLFTDGGANVFTWLTESFGLTALNAADVMDAYIIGLGVNDYSKQASNLGTSSDIVTTTQTIPGSYDSFYGLYSNMIAQIKTKAPRSKIFCLTMSSYHANKTTPKAFNQAIRDIVTAYSGVGDVYLIDLEDDTYFMSKTFRTYWYLAHSTAPGYKSIADHLWNRINDFMNANPSEFKDIQWIIHPETDLDD